MARPIMDLSNSIARGFDDKVADIIRQATSGGAQVSFDNFTDLIMEVNFMTDIFRDTTSKLEIEELSQAVIDVAKLFVVHDTDNYEESCAALFLLYCLLMKQPLADFAPVRFTPDDVPAIKKIETLARDTRRLEVIYILGEILVRGPVEYLQDSRKLFLGFLEDEDIENQAAPSARG